MYIIHFILSLVIIKNNIFWFNNIGLNSAFINIRIN